MKKYFIIAAAAIAAMACSKVEPTSTPDVKVTFQAANYVAQTKANEVSVLNDFNEFSCRGFLHAVGIDIDENGAVISSDSHNPSYQEFFGNSGETISPYNSSNQKITTALTSESTGISYWAPSHEYYWPKHGKSYVSFVGWYGTSGTAAPTINYAYANSKWTASLSWAFSNSTVGQAGANFLYSDVSWRYNDNPSAEYKKNGLANDYKGVPMLFHHALAQINVKAYVAPASGSPAISAGTTTGTVTDGNATWTITLKDVAITNVYNSGTLVLTNDDPGNTTPHNEWTAANGTVGGWSISGDANGFSGPATVAVSEVTKPASTVTTGDIIAKTCVVPQSLGETAALTFKLHILTTYSNNSNEEEIPVSILLAGKTGDGKWVKNTKYTYYIQINPAQKTVRFDPALEADWAEGTTTDSAI